MGKKTKIKLNKGSEPEVNEEIREEEPEISAEEEQETETGFSQEDFDKLNEELEEAKKKAQENLESWQRERADFSNYKKRIERDQEV